MTSGGDNRKTSGGGDTKIKVKIISLNAETLVVDFHNLGLAEVNSFRRNASENVDQMCIDGPGAIAILRNTSDIHDATLQHRIGQIPFKSTSAKTFNYPDTCPCRNWKPNPSVGYSSGTIPTIASVVASASGCDKCRVIFSLNVKNFSTRERRNVNTLDLKCESTVSGTTRGWADVVPTGGDPMYAPLTGMENLKEMVPPEEFERLTKIFNEPPSLFLLPLLPGQEISMVCLVRRGRVRRDGHHKFQAVSLVGLKSPAIIGLNQEKLAKLTPRQRLTISKRSKRGYIVYDPKTTKLSVRGGIATPPGGLRPPSPPPGGVPPPSPLLQSLELDRDSMVAGGSSAPFPHPTKASTFPQPSPHSSFTSPQASGNIEAVGQDGDVPASPSFTSPATSIFPISTHAEAGGKGGRSPPITWWWTMESDHSKVPEELVTAYGQTDAIILLRDTSVYRMTINGIGSLKPEEIMLWAMQAFSEDVRKVHRNLAISQSGKIPELLEQINDVNDDVGSASQYQPVPPTKGKVNREASLKIRNESYASIIGKAA